MQSPIDSNYLQTIANRRANKPVKISPTEVDAIGDYLVQQYGNPAYRGWYCYVVYTIGRDKTLELYERSAKGTYPGRLFSTLAKAYIEAML